MELQFIGADHEVTGSCHYINACGKNLLVDYGMEQGADTFENVDLPVPESAIDFVLLTHAHIDHSGMLPRLYGRGFRGQIFTTEASADLCSIMLRDSAHIQNQEAEWRNRKAQRSASVDSYEVLYTMEDAMGAITQLVPCAYNSTIKVCDGIEIKFTDIGHLLGSAAIEVYITENGVSKKIVFSGDIGNMDQPLIKDPSLIEEADYIITESTYGDRNHGTEKPDYVKELTRIMKETFDKGGNVIIPSFAVGRTQEMLYFLRTIKQDNLLPEYKNFGVYVDSPLAVEATGIFNKNIYNCYDEEAMALVKKGINPISFPGLSLSITSEESKQINFDQEPKVILSASGMCEAGRIRHHLKHNLWRPECTILFVGYQAMGTLGRALVEGAKEVKLFGETIEVRASIEILAGLSGHADRAGLLRWIQGFKSDVSRVFVVHGEDSVCENYTQTLKDLGYNAYAPYSGTRFDLAKNQLIYEAVPVPVQHKIFTNKKANSVFERLVAAAQRLLEVVKKLEGRPNKELAKLADQINSICDKVQ